jgi:hypothetical protein
VVLLALPFRYCYEINLLVSYTRPEQGRPLQLGVPTDKRVRHGRDCAHRLRPPPDASAMCICAMFFRSTGIRRQRHGYSCSVSFEWLTVYT